MCNRYYGHHDDWYNGIWCYANITTCRDANEHSETEEGLQGFGASKIACNAGIVDSNCT